MKILIVDDEEMVRELLAEFFSGEGWDTVTASDGQGGLEEVSRHPDLDIVLSDVMMPRLNGWDFLTQLLLRQSPLAQRFIFMSGNIPDDKLRRAVMQSGCEYIQKPFESLEALLLVASSTAAKKRETT